ncbi:hypothetical protein [Ferruginibacter albus]|uniref:hypothetical protein n=1 Tax=Ferruginibacter albus TaxID=2875540 RepID=UPI001CC4C663|nr:hypothetical protein [Ferruginibacter albus]UAY53324.1 hypothetical protein K9M53_06550 [Ferruginibacter albus]
MNKRNLFIALGMILLITFEQPALSSSFIYNPAFKTITINDDSLRMLQIQKRVLEIQAMDFTKLSAKERKSIYKELRQMQKETDKKDNGGVYLSVGAIIIILLVLILIAK